VQTEATRGRHYALTTSRDDPKHIGWHASRLGDVIVGGCEYLKRSRDIEQLHGRIGQHFDDAKLVGRKTIWRGTRGLWHFRHSLPG
jgi:hypothetical protein